MVKFKLFIYSSIFCVSLTIEVVVALLPLTGGAVIDTITDPSAATSTERLG